MLIRLDMPSRLRNYFKIAVLGCSVMLAGAAFFVIANSVSAQQAGELALQGLSPVQQQVGFGTRDIRDIIVDIVRIFIGFLGLLAIVIVLYGGFMWMTSGGDPAKIEKAKKILINGAIGVVIIFAAYGIVSFIFRALGVGYGSRYEVQGDVSNPGGFGGALGNGILQSHYPPRNAMDVARNTSILVTFKEEMDVSTLIRGGLVNADSAVNTGVHVLILEKTDFENGDLDNALTAVNAATRDNKTFVFEPQQFLGNPVSNTGYVVILGNGLKKDNGDPAFPSRSCTKAEVDENNYGGCGDYVWSFEVSTRLDTTPPTITSVIPKPTNPPTDNDDADQFNDKVARNAIIQINFSEAVNPLTVTGEYKGLPGDFDLLQILNLNNSGVAINGKFEISNQYRTVEFTTDLPCGINSCGEQIFCLPELSTVQVLAKSATLKTSPNADLPFAAEQPSTGVTDVANNVLDGNANKEPDGNIGIYDFNIDHNLSLVPVPTPGIVDEACLATQFNTVTVPNGDNYQYAFCTTDEIDLVPPQVLSYAPIAGAVEVDPRAPLIATFDKNMSATTIRQDSGYGDGYCQCVTSNDCVNTDPENPQACVAGKCVDANSDDQEKITCYRFDPVEQCQSRTLPGQTVASTDLGLCVERDHVTLETPAPNPAVGYWMSLENFSLIESGRAKPRGLVNMDHVRLLEQVNYGLKYGSGLKDLYQNCYIPSAAPGCQRVETETPGQYGYVPDAWPDGGATFPSCDLTSTSLSTQGLFNLSYQDAQDTNKVLPLQAYRYDKDPVALYDYELASSSSRLDKNDYFKEVLKKDIVNFFLYYYQPDVPEVNPNLPTSVTGYYLYVMAGKSDSSITAPTNQFLKFDLTSTSNAFISTSKVISLDGAEEPKVDPFVDASGALKVNLQWPSNQTDGLIYKIGNTENFNFAIKVTDASSGVRTRYVYPGGAADLRNDRSFAVLTVDRDLPVATVPNITATAALDGEGENYNVTVVWDDTLDGDNNRDIAQAFVDLIFPESESLNRPSVALNDQGSSGDEEANDNKWTVTVTYPITMLNEAALVDATASLNTSTKDAAGNSLQNAVAVPIDLLP